VDYTIAPTGGQVAPVGTQGRTPTGTTDYLRRQPIIAPTLRLPLADRGGISFARTPE
jgi:hypothetical protein